MPKMDQPDTAISETEKLFLETIPYIPSSVRQAGVIAASAINQAQDVVLSRPCQQAPID